jgi:hypothetical protein
MDNHRGLITQAAAEDFLATPFFLLLPQIDTFLRDFSTIMIMSSEAFPGLAASKLAIKPQNSEPKGALEICGNTSPLTLEAGICSGDGAEATAKASNEPRFGGKGVMATTRPMGSSKRETLIG